MNKEPQITWGTVTIVLIFAAAIGFVIGELLI
jgi:hypothetical protein